MKEQRQVIKPVDILEPQHHNPISPQVDKTTNLQVSNPTSGQNHKPTKLQTGKPTNPQVEKYTTHLRPETVKAIKVYAAQQDIDDYTVVQEALDRFFNSSKK